MDFAIAQILIFCFGSAIDWLASLTASARELSLLSMPGRSTQDPQAQRHPSGCIRRCSSRHVASRNRGGRLRRLAAFGADVSSPQQCSGRCGVFIPHGAPCPAVSPCDGKPASPPSVNGRRTRFCQAIAPRRCASGRARALICRRREPVCAWWRPSTLSWDRLQPSRRRCRCARQTITKSWVPGMDRCSQVRARPPSASRPLPHRAHSSAAASRNGGARARRCRRRRRR